MEVSNEFQAFKEVANNGVQDILRGEVDCRGYNKNFLEVHGLTNILEWFEKNIPKGLNKIQW